MQSALGVCGAVRLWDSLRVLLDFAFRGVDAGATGHGSKEEDAAADAGHESQDASVETMWLRCWVPALADCVPLRVLQCAEPAADVAATQRLKGLHVELAS